MTFEEISLYVASVAVSDATFPIATACPLCHTEIGQQVRAGIFDADFWSNLFFVLLPFPIFLLLAVALHYGFRRRTPNAKGAELNEPKPDDDMGEERDHGR